MFFRFNVNKKTGLITVAPCEMPGAPHCLDFETKPVYYLNLQVSIDDSNNVNNNLYIY